MSESPSQIAASKRPSRSLSQESWFLVHSQPHDEKPDCIAEDRDDIVVDDSSTPQYPGLTGSPPPSEPSNSPKNLVQAAPMPVRAPGARPLCKALASQLRDTLCLYRVEADCEREKYSSCCRLLEESLDDLAIVLKADASLNPTANSTVAQIDRIKNQFTQDRNALLQQSHKVREADSRVRRLEERIAKTGVWSVAIPEFTIQAATTTLPDVQTGCSDFSGSDGTRRSSCDIPLILQNYFWHIGQVSVIRERIQDIDCDFQGTSAPESCNSVESSIGTSKHDQLLDAYIARPQTLAHELEDAERCADRARQECIENGVDAEDWRDAGLSQVSDTPSAVDPQSHSAEP